MCKKAFITGSSRGIGRAMALRLAKDGYDIVLHGGKSTDKAEEVKCKIKEIGGKASIEIADLTDLAQTKAMFDRIGDIDVLILNASMQYKTAWQNITEKEAYDQINCNFLSSLLCIQKAVPAMQKKGWGRIITVGSVQEVKPHPDMLVYSATKAAQYNMVRSLSVQLAPFGITVNNIAPGVIYTDRNVEALSDPVYAKKVTDSIPAGFYGTPDDCAGMVSLLCSDEGRYITGQSIFIDGGKSVQ